MIYIKLSRVLTEEDLKKRILTFEKKYGCSCPEYYKTIVKGHEEELDEKDLLNEYEDWKYYEKCLKDKKEIKDEMIIPASEKKLSEFLHIFSKKRIELLEDIVTKDISSISELVEITHRDRRAVFSDLEVLKNNNIIDLKSKGKKTIPIPKINSIEVSFA